jgi:hypothetical protein
MAAPGQVFRLTFFYELFDAGWTESVHTKLVDKPSLMTLASQYIAARLPLLHPKAFLTHVRISDDLVFRDILLDPISLPQAGTFATTTLAPDTPWNALDVRIQAGVTVNRSLYLRGIPAGQMNANTFNPTALFAANLGKYLGFLVTNGNIAIKCKDRSVIPNLILTSTALGVVTLATPIANAAAGQRVQLLGVLRSLSPQRSYVIGAGSTTTVLNLLGWPGLVLAGTGFIRQNVVALPQVTDAVCDTNTERRSGRPFGLLRGRRAVIR